MIFMLLVMGGLKTADWCFPGQSIKWRLIPFYLHCPTALHCTVSHSIALQCNGVLQQPCAVHKKFRDPCAVDLSRPTVVFKRALDSSKRCALCSAMQCNAMHCNAMQFSNESQIPQSGMQCNATCKEM